MVNIFEFKSYREWLSALVYKPQSPRGMQTRLSEAAECQKSYFSLVLQEKVHLSADQLLKITLFLRLKDTEVDFALELLNLEKSSSKELTLRTQHKLKEIRQRHEFITTQANAEILKESDSELIYHSSWYYSAIHLLVSIPKYQSIELISEYLKIDKNYVKMVLKNLKQMGFIDEYKGFYQITKKNVHLPRHSPLFNMTHANWRLKAMEDAQKLKSESLHYTSLHTISYEDFLKFKEMFLDFIERSRHLVAPSKDETLICIAMDLFEI